MTIDEVRAKVQRMLIELLGSAEVDKDGDFKISWESTGGYVKVVDYGDDGFVVQIWAYLLFNVPETPELFEWIAKNGNRYYFGSTSFNSWDKDGETKTSLVFEHNLFANFLDLDELGHALFGVFSTADKLDNELQGLFGGDLVNP